MISKLEYACEVDQLNLATLLSFEVLVRRAQLIEQAHVASPSNPDYTNSDFFMGWGAQRGGALVAPQLYKHVATKAKEKAAVMKETRKHQEELALRRKQGQGGQKGDSKGKGKGAEAAPPHP